MTDEEELPRKGQTLYRCVDGEIETWVFAARLDGAADVWEIRAYGRVLATHKSLLHATEAAALRAYSRSLDMQIRDLRDQRGRSAEKIGALRGKKADLAGRLAELMEEAHAAKEAD